MALNEIEIEAIEEEEIIVEVVPEKEPEAEAEELTRVSFGHSPKPSSDAEDATWLFWDEAQGKYVDSGFLVGIKAGGDTVYSVNGKTKRVELTAKDVGALPEDTKIPGKTSDLENDTGYLTEHQSLAEYAKKSELPTVPENVSAFQNDAGYLTEHQDLTEYAKKSELPTVPENVSAFQNDAGYLTEHQSLAEYAKKSELPTVPAPVTEATVAGWGFTKNTGTYVKPAGGIPAGDLAKGVIPAVPTKVSDLQNDAGYLTEHQSLAEYAKKSELPTVPAPVTEATVAGWGFTKNAGTYVKPAGGIPAGDLANGVIPAVPTKVSDLQNDAGYLTEHQSLAEYAKKSELPTVPGNVSAFQNDAGYLTEHQSLAEYAKKSEIPAAVTDAHINSLINAALGVIENGAY